LPTVQIVIDGKTFSVVEGISVLEAARASGIYIPGLCSHPDLDAFKSFNWSKGVWQGKVWIAGEEAEGESELPHCELCLVAVNGNTLQRSCDLQAVAGMTIRTTGDDIHSARRESLKRILANHPHACLTCAQREGCSCAQCSMNVPVEERCCELLNRCEIGKLADFIGITSNTPAYRHSGRPVILDEPLFIRDYELCIGCTRCVRICRDVRGVDVLGATLSAGRVLIGTTGGASLVESLCRFCGACVAICPTGALRDQSNIAALVDGEAPCVVACPLGIDVPGYLELIADGRDYEALELIRQRAVLPGALGYACFHPCEEACRRGALDAPASICALKRFASDAAGIEPPHLIKAPPTGKRAAVIGGGPAGLAAAADLLRAGHQITLFDRSEQLGGMLRVAIPDFRLPDQVIDRDLKYLMALGLEIRLGMEINDDFVLQRLLYDGFDAVVLAVGRPKSARLGVEGEDLENVMPGLIFLNKAAERMAPRLDGDVIVIGGGNVAVDVARTARRLGSAQVKMICLETRAEIPAFAEELDEAALEGVEIITGWGVSYFNSENGKVREIVLKKCIRVFDEKRCFNPAYDPERRLSLPANWVIVAIGQSIESKIHPNLLNRPGVFAAGDFVLGSSSIVKAMADGRKAAQKVNEYLGCPDFVPNDFRQYQKIDSGYLGRDPEFHRRQRPIPDRLALAARLQTMQPVETTLTAEQARAEAHCCLKCHLRATISPAPLPPDEWKRFEAGLELSVPQVEGVLILADATRKPVKITGVEDIRAACAKLITDKFAAAYCRWEADPMFTKRESELIQAHLQNYGEIPDADELDELF